MLQRCSYRISGRRCWVAEASTPITWACIEIGLVERKVFPELGTAFAIWLGQTGPGLKVEYELLETEDEFDQVVCLEMTGFGSAAGDHCSPRIDH
jgi:hypothetical protein